MSPVPASPPKPPTTQGDAQSPPQASARGASPHLGPRGSRWQREHTRVAGLSWPGAAGVLAANRGFLQLSSQSCTERVPRHAAGWLSPPAVLRSPQPRAAGFWWGQVCSTLCCFFWGGRLRPSGSHSHNGSLEKKKLPGKRHRCACSADVGTNPHVPRQAPPRPHGAPRPPSTTSCCAFWSQPRHREESRGSRAGMETADNETAATLSSPSSSVSVLVSSINVLG